MCKCDRCGKEVDTVRPMMMPMVTAFRDNIKKYDIVQRHICNTCTRSLVRWWIEGKVASMAPGGSLLGIQKVEAWD